MNKKIYESLEITDLKDMLNKTNELYGYKTAYKIKIQEGQYKIFTHSQVRDMINSLGTALIDMGLKGKRIGVIGQNRYEWEIAYLSIVCGAGIVVPMDKSLPENELKQVIKRSNVEAIFCTEKYISILEKIKRENIGSLKYLISMDSNRKKGIYSQQELIEKGKELINNGDKKFTKAEINAEEMSIMLFTSGTTSNSKIVALSHKNICTNLMDLGSILDVNSDDIMLSVLPIHHVFECTVGFLFAFYKGAQTVFSDGIKHIIENLNEYHVSVMANVPGVYERILKIVTKKINKQGKDILKEFKQSLGGNIKLFISGAAAISKSVESTYRNLGINMVQGYGLTETSPVLAIGTNNYYKTGSVGRTVPSIEAKLVNVNKEGIGELVVKGPSVMIGYFENEDATKEVLKNGWFYTGDLARIDDDGYIFICGRKKSVIVLQNGKNIFPEEIESLINSIDGIKESFVFGKQQSENENDIRISAKIVFDRGVFKIQDDNQIYTIIHEKIKEINNIMPHYKAIREIILTEEPLIKTTTNKIKRQENLNAIK